MHAIPIRSPLDITTARNVLRRAIAGPGYSPIFRARAAATLTAVGEFVLAAHATGRLDLVSINQEGSTKGIELRCSVMTADDLQHITDNLTKQVADVTDNLEFFRGSDRLLIVAKVWINQLDKPVEEKL